MSDPSPPKEGTIERIVLDKLLDSEDGCTYLDFDPALGITEDVMDEIIERLAHGIYESEDDDERKFDA